MVRLKQKGRKIMTNKINEKRYLTMNTKDGSVRIVIAKSYWKALKNAQEWYGSQTGIRVWKDTLSTT